MSSTNKKSILDLNTTYVSGPYNVVRLEGQVDGSETKVIYLFFDIHLMLAKQNECSNIGATDFAEFFVKTFKDMPSSNRMYDFFLEIYPTDSGKVKMNTFGGVDIDPTTRHIEKVLRLFSKLFVYSTSSDKVEPSDVFKNLRLHYFDIRDYFEPIVSHDISPVEKILLNAKNYSGNKLNLSPELTTKIQNRFRRAISNIEVAIAILRSPKKPSKTTPIIANKFNPSKGFLESNMNRLAYKIRHSYAHPEVKRIVVVIFEKAIRSMEILVDTMDYFLGHMTMSDDALGDFYHIKYMFIDSYSKLIDAFFLRRFLDKTYITNGIVYGGGNHMLFYVYVLVKYMNFKVTHIAHNYKKYSIDKINKYIQTANNMTEIVDLFSITHRSKYERGDWEPQCSSLSDFPKNFS
jgi:hypothetical protein